MARFHTPPEDQGQMVWVSYALAGNFVIRRVHDLSDGEVSHFVSEAHEGDAGDYWNGPPANRDWRPVGDDELAALLGEDGEEGE